MVQSKNISDYKKLILLINLYFKLYNSYANLCFRLYNL